MSLLEPKIDEIIKNRKGKCPHCAKILAYYKTKKEPKSIAPTKAWKMKGRSTHTIITLYFRCAICENTWRETDTIPVEK